MTGTKHTLDESAMARLGARLRDTRLGMGFSTGGLAPSLMAARTQIEDIEAGRMGTFYSAHYYLSLFQRYASFLQIPPEELERMLRELKGEPEPGLPEPQEPEAQAPDAHEPQPHEPVPNETLPNTSDGAEGSQAPAFVPLFVVAAPPEPAPTHEPAQIPQPAQPSQPSQSSPKPRAASSLGDWLLILLVLIAAGAVAWVLLSEQSSQTPQPSPTVEAPSVARPLAQAPAPAAPAPAKTAPATTAPATTAPATTAPAAPAPTAPAASPPAAPATTAPAVPLKPIAEASEAVSPDSVVLALTFPQKSWIWVRRADDTVSEVGVAAGSTLRFAEMPVFLVLPRPGEVQVTVRGRKAKLARTDEDRDVGRFSRTMLEDAAAR